LEWAAENGCHIVRAFLARKDGSKPEDRAFALNLAAQNGHTSIVTTLLDDSSTKAATDSRQNTALHLAAKGGHSETLVQLLTHSRGATLFQIDDTKMRGMTPLHVAAQAGHEDIVEILLRHKAKTDLTDKRSKTALQLAAENGHLPCVETILRPEYGADPKAVDSLERTALHQAAQNGHLAVVKRLCAFKDIIWTKDRNHFTAFDLVVNPDKVKEVEEFIQILEDTADDGTEFVRGGSPLHVIARHKNMDILRLLLDKGWKCDAKDVNAATPLHIAVKYKFLQGIEVLLQNPLCDITARDDYGSTVMHYARAPEPANSLLEAGAENDQKDNGGRTPLYLAAYRGCFEVVQALLNSTPKPDVHTKENNDWTLPHAAYDSPPITELMLEHNVDPNALRDDGRTPLALTIRWNFPENAKLLLGAGADPNLAGDFKNSPLYMVLERENSLSLIQLLADNGADRLTKDSDGNTALHVAAQRDKRPEVEYLVQKLGDIETTEISDIYASVLCECVLRREFNSELAEILVSRGLDVNRTTEPHFTALHAACSKGSLDAVKWLLEKKANVNMPGGKHGTTVCRAVENEKDAEEKVRLLREKRAYIDFVKENQPTALQRATYKANATLIDLLLNKGANVNLTGGDLDTPLNAAILGGVRLATISTMLANGADTSKTGIGGQSPVHVAATSDRVDVLQVMVSAVADPLSRDTDGQSALMHGVVNRSADVVNYLLANNVFDVSEADAKVQTPLIVATVLGSKAIVNMLVERGFSKPEILNAQDYEGKTALANAASLDYLEIVRKLVDSGADPRIVDCRDRSPLYWAARAARMETLDIIIAAFEKCDGHTIECWNFAVHGAVASNKRQALERLLEKEVVDVEYAGPDGWSPLYTARRYESYRMEHTLQEGAGVTSPFTPDLKRLSSWHSNDRFPGLELESNGTTLSTVGKFVIKYNFGNKTMLIN
jgi:ankyrin repeat protein